MGRKKDLQRIQKLGRRTRQAVAATDQQGGPLGDALEHLSHAATWVEDISAKDLNELEDRKNEQRTELG